MVPEGWRKCHLRNLIDGGIKNGYSPNAAHHETGYWVLGLGALGEHSFISTEIKPVELTPKVEQTLLTNGDFLVSRSNTPDKVGRSIRFKGEIPNCSYPDLMMRFRVDESEADPDFIEANLKSTTIRSYYKNCAAGSSSTMVKINKATVEKTPILLPPLGEQKKIAKILSTWDKAIATVEKLIANSQQQKKALMQQLLTGKKRPPGFGGEWKYLTFDDAFKVSNKKSSQVKSSEYLDSGSIPIVDQSQRLIAGYCNSDDAYSDIPVIVFGDHTRCIKWIDFVFCPGADGTQVLKPKKALDKKFGYYVLGNADIANLGYSRHMRELKEKEFKVPMDVEEQKKISKILTAADREIGNLQSQLEQIKQEKKALMQQLLTGKRRVRTDNKEVA